MDSGRDPVASSSPVDDVPAVSLKLMCNVEVFDSRRLKRMLVFLIE
jgi:hypothetical protein